MNTPFTKKLLEKYLEGKCTIEEIERVEHWYTSFENELPLFVDEQSSEALELQEHTKSIINNIIAHSEDQSANQHAEDDDNLYFLDSQRKFFTLFRVAAAVLILVTASVYFFYTKQSASGIVAKQITPARKQPADIVPGGNKALLTLADGSTIVLDSAGSGALALQGNTRVIKLADGRIVYDASLINVDGQQQAGIYNTLSTPRAAQYELILPDGTKVWLNAASSIRYPTAFAGKERVVEITGEAYFEVAKMFVHHTGTGSKKQALLMPFRVKVKEMVVEVLGTHFNVNAYDEEQTIRTTLLEGSVKVKSGNRQVLIKPGEQANLNTSGVLNIENANVNEVVAWKNGLFQFENASIQTVMRQVARWYDVEVVYEGQVTTDRFQGKLYRNTEISQLLKILELSGARFKIEGKKIIVQ